MEFLVSRRDDSTMLKLVTVLNPQAETLAISGPLLSFIDTAASFESGHIREDRIRSHKFSIFRN